MLKIRLLVIISFGIFNTYAFDGVFAKGEIKYDIDSPKIYCRPAGMPRGTDIYKEEMFQLIFPQMPSLSALLNSAPFTVDRLHYLLDEQAIATDVNGDNCRNSDPNSNGSDLITIYNSTQKYQVTEHIFALYTQAENNCAIAYRVYRTLDAKFWTLPVKLKMKKGHGAIVDLGILKDVDCQALSIDDKAVQTLLKKELKKSFIQKNMKPEIEEKY